MSESIEAVYDGQVLRPETLLRIEPNTRVRITVEPLPPDAPSFIRTAIGLKLEGPPDWSANWEKYLNDGVPDES